MTQPFPCFPTRPSKNNECSYAGVIITVRGKGFSGWNQIEAKLLQLMVKFVAFMFQYKTIFCPGPKGNIKRKIFLSLPREDRCLMST